MIIEFSESDILSSKVVTPAWYKVQIDDIEEKMSKDGQSMNSWIKGHIICNADDGSKEFANVPTPFLWLFNSKGAWAAVGFCASLGMEPGVGKRADLSAAKGQVVEMFIGNGLNQNGIITNTVTGQYRRPRS